MNKVYFTDEFHFMQKTARINHLEMKIENLKKVIERVGSQQYVNDNLSAYEKQLAKLKKNRAMKLTFFIFFSIKKKDYRGYQQY